MPYKTVPLLMGGDGPDKDKPIAQLIQWHEDETEFVADVESCGTTTVVATDVDETVWESRGSFDMTKTCQRENQ